MIIECAFFDPDHIARTGQKLQLTSDARQRFERGVDPAFLDDGLAIATRLVLDLAAGRASGVTRAGEPPLGDAQLRLRSGARRDARRPRSRARAAARDPRNRSVSSCTDGSGTVTRRRRGGAISTAPPISSRK